MAKNNIRSFRFSDEVAAILERQPGKNLNEKFESLILWKSLEKDALEAETVTLRQQTEKAREELKRVQMVVSSLETIRRALEPLEILASGINVTQIASEEEATPLDSAHDVLQKPSSRRKPARNVTQIASEGEAALLDSAHDVLQKAPERRKSTKNVTQKAPEGKTPQEDVLQKMPRRRKSTKNVTQKALEGEEPQEDVLQAHNTSGNNPQ